MRLYKWALELGAGEHEIELRTALGDALADAGRGRESAEAYLTTVSLVSPPRSLVMRRLAAAQFLTSGHVERGLRLLKEVMQDLDLEFPASARRVLLLLLFRRLQLALRFWFSMGRHAAASPPPARSSTEESAMRMAACRSAAKGLGMMDNVRGAYFQARGLLLALEAGDEVQIAPGIALEVCFVAAAGVHHRQRILQLLARCTEIAERLYLPYPRAMMHLGTGVSGVLGGRWREGPEARRRAIALFSEKCTGASWELNTAKVMELWCLWFCGNLKDLWRLTAVYQQQAEAHGNLYAEMNLRGAWVPSGWLARDEAEQAEQEARTVLAAYAHQAFHLQHWNAIHAQVDAAIYQGRGLFARQLMLGARKDARRALLDFIQLARMSGNDLSGRACLAAAVESPASEREPLLREARRFARSLEKEKHEPSTLLALLLRAGEATLRHDRRRAASFMARAKAGLLAAGMQLYAELAELRIAQLEATAAFDRRTEEAEQALRSRGVVRVDRCAFLLAPGLYERGAEAS